jgi:ubiquinone/menaquinone biosynthesis C-methylase UbiE
VSTKASYIGDEAKSFVPDEDWYTFGSIGEAIRKGGSLKEGPRETTFWEDVVVGLIPLGVPVAQTICDLLQINEGKRKGWKVLDLACGSGIYGYTILQRDPLATVTDLDLENVLKIAHKVAEDMGVVDRVTYQARDIVTSDYGYNTFNIAIISHILQGFDPDTIKVILDKVYKALVPGGTLVIHEFVPDEERISKSFPLLFAVYMFLVTPGGGTYTFSEFSHWLKEVGFSHSTLHDLPGPTSLIIGHKADSENLF